LPPFVELVLSLGSERRAMELTVTMVDYAPQELEKQVPFKISILRMLPGPDRPDYWLGELQAPLDWDDDGKREWITHVVVATRWLGTQIEPSVKDLPIGISFVVDPTQIEDASLDFNKCRYVAIGVAYETSGGTEPATPKNILAGRIGPFFGKGKSR
jgi:hypothetical protein